MSNRSREDGVLTEQIIEIFQAHQGMYGSSLVHAQLKAQGIRCGRKRVVRLMQRAGLATHGRTHRVSHDTQQAFGTDSGEGLRC